MIRSPGSKRYTAFPVPEEVQLKLGLLGIKLIWQRLPSRYVVALFARQAEDGSSGRFITLKDIFTHGWDAIVDHLADTAVRGTTPVGWNGHTIIEPIKIEAAAVIDEGKFNVES
jgi:hypothetical protein